MTVTTHFIWNLFVQQKALVAENSFDLQRQLTFLSFGKLYFSCFLRTTKKTLSFVVGETAQMS